MDQSRFLGCMFGDNAESFVHTYDFRNGGLLSKSRILLAVAMVSFGLLLTACGSGGGGDPPGNPGGSNPVSGSGGTLTLTGAPASTEGAFVAKNPSASINPLVLGWAETNANASHGEVLTVIFSPTGQMVGVMFKSNDFSFSSGGSFTPVALLNWQCASDCSGITVDRTAGTFTFSNTVLTGADGLSGTVPPQPITLNGTLTFTPSASTVPAVTTGNNSALLSGATIGKGTTAIGDLRKQIAVTVLGTNPSLTVGTAFATRPVTSLDYAYIILPVTNTGSQTLCFVKLAGITYRDASSAALLSNGITFARGSVGKVSSTSFTDTCLAPGETGMVGEIKANLYAAVAKMEFTLESSASAISAPAARVIPQSYAVQSATLAIAVKNSGSGPALVGAQNRFHTWFLFDDAMQPLTWGLTDLATPSVVAANGAATITVNVLYDGSGSKLLVFTNFEDTTQSANAIVAKSVVSNAAADECPTFLSPDEFTMCLNESRNRQLATLETFAR